MSSEELRARHVAALLKAALDLVSAEGQPATSARVRCYHRFPSGAGLHRLDLDGPDIALAAALIIDGPYTLEQRRRLLEESWGLTLIGNPLVES